MDLALEGKKVVVTGGAKGIGASIVRSFAKGVRHLTRRNPDEAGELINEIVIGHSFHLELTNLIEIESTAKRISEEIGEIDILVNNAGVNDGIGLEEKPIKFIESLSRNLVHPFALAHHFINDLKKTRGVI